MTWLWFGDERRYYTTHRRVAYVLHRCGLVMKEDITQRTEQTELTVQSCGLVMKEDITQLLSPGRFTPAGCGLVMKEDITQQKMAHS